MVDPKIKPFAFFELVCPEPETAVQEKRFSDPLFITEINNWCQIYWDMNDQDLNRMENALRYNGFWDMSPFQVHQECVEFAKVRLGGNWEDAEKTLAWARSAVQERLFPYFVEAVEELMHSRTTEQRKDAAKWFFLYNGEHGQPYKSGWTQVEAPDVYVAVNLFRCAHPDRDAGRVNCERYLSQEEFEDEPRKGKCHEIIKWQHDVLETPVGGKSLADYVEANRAYFLNCGYTPDDYAQIIKMANEKAFEFGIFINKREKKIGWKTALEKLGSNEFLSGIGRSAFHWTSARLTEAGEEVSFDTSRWHKS